jgi:hypothetical protein
MKKPPPILTPRIIADMRPGEEFGDPDHSGLRVRRTISARVFFYPYRSPDGALREIELGEFGAMTLAEPVRAFVTSPLPPDAPPLAAESYAELNRHAELALARLSGVAGLVPSVDWLLHSAIRKEALLTSQIEGTQASLTDLFDQEAGFSVSNTDDVEEVAN